MQKCWEKDIVYDIGAHIGYYSSIFNNVTKSKKVVSLEPDFYASNLIRRNTNERSIVLINSLVVGQS